MQSSNGSGDAKYRQGGLKLAIFDQYLAISQKSCKIETLLVMPRLDYGNATLAGLPASQLRRLQSVLNAAARLIHRS